MAQRQAQLRKLWVVASYASFIQSISLAQLANHELLRGNLATYYASLMLLSFDISGKLQLCDFSVNFIQILIN
jgi:hypothetical protein